MLELPLAIEERLQRLPKGLREHTERARQIARELAHSHGIHLARVDLGTAAHDLSRALNGKVLLAHAKFYRLRMHPVERRNPMLLHGRVAAMWLQQTAGVNDREILEAVQWHTTGKKDMGPVAKIVFLADKLDPMKANRYPYQGKIKSIAQESLDRALLEFLNHNLVHLMKEGHLVHPASVGLRNQLIMTLE